MKSFFTIIFWAIFVSSFGQNTNIEETPIQIVRRVFKSYIKYSEGTDSQENKDSMENALNSLQKSISQKDLPLLINVWIYYDPTDFPTKTFVEVIFDKNKSTALFAIEQRIKHKKKWESKENLSDLVALKEKLSR